MRGSWKLPCLPLLILLPSLTAYAAPTGETHGTPTPTALPKQAEKQEEKQQVEDVTCKLVRGDDPSGLKDHLECGGRTFIPGHARVKEAEEVAFGSAEWIFYFSCCLCCIVSAALAAGLTMGLVSLEEFNLELLLEMRPEELKTDEERTALIEDQASAKSVKPLLSGHFFGPEASCVPKAIDPTNHHYLLVTLLVVNAMANEALPVFLDNLVPAWAAVLISVSFVLVFGEIIPSAIFTGPNQLAIAAKFAGCVKVLKGLLMPIVWPISITLDKVLGHEEDEGFNRGKIKALARLQRNDSSPVAGLEREGLTKDEIDIIHGTLDLHHRPVADIQENIDSAKSLPNTAVLNLQTVADLLHMGCSRVFVYDGDKRNIRGVIIVRKLIAINPEDHRPIAHIPLRKPTVLSPEETLLSTLNQFQTGRSHLALVSPDPDAVKKAWKNGTPIPENAQPTGFVTLEDIFEELLQDEVFDEEDRESIFGTLAKASKMQRIKGWIGRARTRVMKRELEDSEGSGSPALGQPLLHRFQGQSAPALRQAR